MPQFIASYDLKVAKPDPHDNFLTNAMEHGWYPWILDDDDTLFTLPNTTLEGSFVDQMQALAALNAARAQTEKELGIRITMEKWIVAQYVVDPAFDSNEKEKARNSPGDTSLSIQAGD
ncbi:hypothetical protein [Bradyrhizobium iriomotense]|uniref:Uncharacterized protein n=1 Tax=Bradyrhizobium iriomotense TaxID=441950 RepID=A0ABQ6BEU4_9BRAD|nr:hypothetical protein [Bradyrhizobium iriomotense]GLR91131.1 hypothetical protein GCM10007857_78470 [Bradyrhizobium iriomotense]